MFQNSGANKIIAIISAIVLWVYVVGSVDPLIQHKYEHIPVQLINQDSLTGQNLAVHDTGDLFVDLVLKGSRADIAALKEDEIRVSADLYGRHQGNNYVALDVQVPKGIRVESKSLDKVIVQIEDLVSETRPIELEVKGDLPSGKVLGKTEIFPKEITVSGAKSSLNEINKVVAKVNASKIEKENTELTSNLYPINDKGVEVNYVTLSQKTASVKAELDLQKEVPLDVKTVGKVNEAYSVEAITVPNKIWIQGSEEVLKNINRIQGEDVDISKVTKNTKLLVSPQLPPGVKLSKLSKGLAVSVTLAPQTSKDLNYSSNEIKLKNLGDGFEGHVKGSIKVTISGKEEVTSTFDKGDLEVYLDLEGLKEGTHKVPVKTSHQKNGVGVALYPGSIKIEIK